MSPGGTGNILGMQLIFEVAGEVQINRELSRFVGRAENMEPAFEQVIEAMQHDIEELFATEGGSVGRQWEPLKAATLQRKESLGQNKGILRATDELFESLTGESAHTVKEVDPAGFIFGSDVFYGIFHQKGAPRAGIPVRRPIDSSEVQRRGYIKIMQRYLIEGL